MKIRLIAPIPPPLNGHSFISQEIFKYLNKTNDVELINISSGETKAVRKFFYIINILRLVFKSSFHQKVTYLTISESFLGNIKDLFIYFLLYRQLDSLVIHLHGGSIYKNLWSKNKIIYLINIFFIKKVNHIILSGDSHKNIFNFVNDSKIKIIQNFADDSLLISEHKLNEKLYTDKVNILYMSGMRKKKGYKNLLKAFLSLDKSLTSNVKLNFAGNFLTPKEESQFRGVIEPYNNIDFYGFVEKDDKRKLLHSAKIFCFPSLYNEGQPISIIEAYYAGCAVITSSSDGVSDIFIDNENGFCYQRDDVQGLALKLKNLISNIQAINRFAKFNHSRYDFFKKESFMEKIASSLKACE